MKIKNLIIFYPSFEKGGVEEIIKNLITNNKKTIKNIFLITNKNKNLKSLKKTNNLKIRSIKINQIPFIPFRLWSSIICSFSLSKIITKLDNQDTVIHSMQSNILAIIVAKFYGFKIAIRNSEDPISSIKYAENKILSLVIFLSRFFLYNLADRIITNSKGSAESLKLFLFGKNKDKIKHIYNPYLSKKKIKLGKIKKPKSKTILFVGRLTKQKNLEMLINSFYQSKLHTKSFKLIIIGDGKKKKELINLSIKLGIEKHIKFLGYKKDVNKYYYNAKLFILSSIYEGLGNVLIDALNFNVPCIATDCKSGPREILCYGKGGILIKNKESKLLTKAILYSINNYDLSLKKMSYGKKHLKRFYISSQSKIYFDTLDKLL